MKQKSIKTGGSLWLRRNIDFGSLEAIVQRRLPNCLPFSRNPDPCFGDTFRFRDQQGVSCLACSSSLIPVNDWEFLFICLSCTINSLCSSYDSVYIYTPTFLSFIAGELCLVVATDPDRRKQYVRRILRNGQKNNKMQKSLEFNGNNDSL